MYSTRYTILFQKTHTYLEITVIVCSVNGFRVINMNILFHSTQPEHASDNMFRSTQPEHASDNMFRSTQPEHASDKITTVCVAIDDFVFSVNKQ